MTSPAVRGNTARAATATAGETASEGPTRSTTVQDPGPINDTYRRSLARLRYSTEDDAIDNISSERQDQRKQERATADRKIFQLARHEPEQRRPTNHGTTPPYDIYHSQ